MQEHGWVVPSILHGGSERYSHVERQELYLTLHTIPIPRSAGSRREYPRVTGSKPEEMLPKA
jgi:hypothetical protein